ncbi:Glycosyl transferase family 1 [Trinorchestia longiramus]|nr:Glycosyl transferase family 1 [Trinorchestia longiramus]
MRNPFIELFHLSNNLQMARDCCNAGTKCLRHFSNTLTWILLYNRIQSYCPILCGLFSPCSVDIGRSFGGVVPKFELVNLSLKKPGSRLEHQGVKIEFVGQIELYYDRGNQHEFTSLVKELARPGELIHNTSYDFEFNQVEKPYESYTGTNVRLRYFLRVTIVRRISDIVRDMDLIVHTLSSYPDSNNSIKMEVGIEDCLHIEFEYNKSKYHLKDVIVGKIYFLLVRIKIKHMEIAIMKRETTGSGPNTFNENETIAKYEIMDGAPVRGESIPIRVFLAGYDLTPSMRDINKKFSVRYYLNLVLVDEEERRYFKQQCLHRDAQRSVCYISDTIQMLSEDDGRRMVICMVSDFLYPNVGGVEEHIFQLSQCLLQRGHKVVAVTHVYDDRRGIRYMTNGLKVYYLPIQPFYNQSVLPTFLTSVPLLRDVLLRERVDVVHGHSAFSTMAHEAMSVASALGIKTVFTDHSLFGFADVSSIVTNNFLTMSLACVDRCICVSYVGKENTVLRACVPPERVSVIPNALDTTAFRPRPYDGSPDRVVVVVMCRLQYRKGVDLQPPIIRHICSKFPNVDFIIGGGGPKMGLLSEVRDEVGPERVTLLGPVPHASVPSVLSRGHIFLNTSLTEAFCIAICEAVAAGLQVVSTDVGGIPEVLPPDLITLAQPTVGSLCEALDLAIRREVSGDRLAPHTQHRLMQGLYSWPDVALRTERVYCSALTDALHRPLLPSRMKRYLETGGVLAGGFMVLLVALQAMLLCLCDYFRPAQHIDHAADFPPLPMTKLNVSADVTHERRSRDDHVESLNKNPRLVATHCDDTAHNSPPNHVCCEHSRRQLSRVGLRKNVSIKEKSTFNAEEKVSNEGFEEKLRRKSEISGTKYNLRASKVQSSS